MRCILLVAFLLTTSPAKAGSERNVVGSEDVKARKLKKEIQSACPELELDSMFASSFLFSNIKDGGRQEALDSSAFGQEGKLEVGE